MQVWTQPFRLRRQRGQSHPVHDFLFVYYHYSPAKLEQWHPVAGEVLLEGTCGQPSWWTQQYYARCGPQGRDLVMAPARLEGKTRSRMQWTRDLLVQTASRRPNFSCLGLHEWAMVYRGQEIRHEQTTRLRLSQAEVDQLVESRPLSCTHFDAFRFFADEAQPLNILQPTLSGRPQQEQPACIHANMDLYKWAYKCMPWIGSELLADCFELALQARTIDMRASPYDLSSWPGHPPIRIETSAGRAEYEREQRRIAERAEPLRQRLVAAIERILAGE